MLTRKLTLVALVGSVLLLSGCFSTPSARTGNQGGSSLPQALSKIAADRLNTLNPDDVQVLADFAMDAMGASFPPVTDDQAAAVVSFIAANSLTDRASVEALIARAQRDPDDVVIPPDVQQVLEQIAADPAYITAAENFSHTF